jgi:hypothetical protein
MIKSNARRTRWVRVALGLVALLGLTELGLRVAGLGEFPTYLRDDQFGYIPKPNQAGRFLQRNEWVFNDRSMGVATPWQASDRTDILLVGNSIVLGGNAYNQSDKLAPLMQSQLRASCSVWPVAAGGWATVNEFRYLDRQPDVVAGANFFVWEYMANQMGGLASWSRSTLHPLERPLWLTGYVVGKALDQRFPTAARFEVKAPSDEAPYFAEFETMLERLTQASGRRPAGVIFLYPDLQQLEMARAGKEWLPDRAEVQRLAARHGVMLIDLAAMPQWKAGLYKDGVHPSVEGNAVMATILANEIRRLAHGC